MGRTLGWRFAALGVAAMAGMTTVASTNTNTNSGTIDALQRMTLKEKVGQLFMTYAYGRTADTAHPQNEAEFGVATPAQVVREYHLGGLIHFGWTDSLYEPRQVAELSNGVQRAALDSKAGVPLLISTDQEQGEITRVGEPASQFPGNMALGAGRSAADAERAGAIIGQELRAMGLNFNLAPSADVNVNPANPVIGVRSFSADPELTAELTAAQIRGFQDAAEPTAGVSASVKHFPGHGDTDVDSHSGLPVIHHDREQWENLDAPPFQRAIAEGTDSVMSAHLELPQLDDSGEPATLSRNVLTGMLREELGFDGVLVTDSLQMEGVREQHPDPEIAVRALEAGADILLMPNDLRAAIDGVLDAVHSGRLSEQRIDRSVHRVLRMKEERGIMQDPFTTPEHAARFVGAAEHRRAAQEITDRGTTMLRNDAGNLPLREPPRDMLVTGAGEDATAELAARVEARGTRTETLSTGQNPTSEQVAEAARAADNHELAVVLTDAAWDSDNARQRELLRTLSDSGTPVVAVAVRDPYDAAYAERIPTWLATYSDKAVAMESLARVLFGEQPPRGKLPVAVPDPNNAGSDRYPFGHGLHW